MVDSFVNTEPWKLGTKMLPNKFWFCKEILTTGVICFYSDLLGVVMLHLLILWAGPKQNVWSHTFHFLPISCKITLETSEMITSIFERRLSASLVVCQPSFHFRVFNRYGWTWCFHNVQNDNFMSTDSSNAPLMGALFRDLNLLVLPAIQDQSRKPALSQTLFYLKRRKRWVKSSGKYKTTR